jgi:hypothetical protein
MTRGGSLSPRGTRARGTAVKEAQQWEAKSQCKGLPLAGKIWRSDLFDRLETVKQDTQTQFVSGPLSRSALCQRVSHKDELSYKEVLMLAMSPRKPHSRGTFNQSGQILINATVDLSQNKFRLRWVESGGPPVQMPTRRSFGSKLIEHSFVRQLHGESQLTFAASGVIGALDIPRLETKEAALLGGLFNSGGFEI